MGTTARLICYSETSPLAWHFATSTANTKWRELTNNMYPNQSAKDGSDIVARVFELKEKISTDLAEKNIFGSSPV